MLHESLYYASNASPSPAWNGQGIIASQAFDWKNLNCIEQTTESTEDTEKDMKGQPEFLVVAVAVLCALCVLCGLFMSFALLRRSVVWSCRSLLRSLYRAKRVTLSAIVCSSAVVRGVRFRKISQPARMLPPGGLASEP